MILKSFNTRYKLNEVCNSNTSSKSRPREEAVKLIIRSAPAGSRLPHGGFPVTFNATQSVLEPALRLTRLLNLLSLFVIKVLYSSLVGMDKAHYYRKSEKLPRVCCADLHC